MGRLLRASAVMATVGCQDSGRKTAFYSLHGEQLGGSPLSELTMEDYCAAVDALLFPDLSATAKAVVAKNLGCKFVSCLTQLPYFDAIRSCVEDFLPRFSLGVCRQLTAATFGYKTQAESTLQLPAALDALVAARAVALSEQLPGELHTRLPAPNKSWPFYNGAHSLPLPDKCLLIPARNLSS